MIQDWVRIYKKHGIQGLLIKGKNKSYSKEFKLQVIMEYLNGEGSSIDLGLKYDLAYVVSMRNDNRLVFRTFDKAIATNSEAKPIFHSDRGF